MIYCHVISLSPVKGERRAQGRDARRSSARRRDQRVDAASLIPGRGVAIAGHSAYSGIKQLD